MGSSPVFQMWVRSLGNAGLHSASASAKKVVYILGWMPAWNLWIQGSPPRGNASHSWSYLSTHVLDLHGKPEEVLQEGRERLSSSSSNSHSKQRSCLRVVHQWKLVQIVCSEVWWWKVWDSSTPRGVSPSSSGLLPFQPRAHRSQKGSSRECGSHSAVRTAWAGADCKQKVRGKPEGQKLKATKNPDVM